MTEEQAHEEMVATMELRDRLVREHPGLHPMTAVIMAGDLRSAERATAEVNAGVPAERAYVLVGSYARWEWCLQMVAQGALTDNWFMANIADLWRGSDPDDTNPDYLRVWQQAFARHGGIIRDGRPLPKGMRDGRLRVYRGGNPFEVRKGFAWTTDPKIAQKFADGAGERIQRVNGVVVVGYVRPSVVLAFLTERGESEVIVDPRLVENVHPHRGPGLVSPYVDTPEARLRSALEQTSPAATFVRVEVIDLRAYMDMQDRINQRLDGWVGKTTIRTSLDNAQAMLRGKS